MTRRSLRLKLLALGLAGVSLLAACGDDDDDAGTTDDGAVTTLDSSGDATTTAPAAAGAADAITIEGFAFSAATVKPGASVTIDNKDSAPHTVTADENSAFDSGSINGGASGTITAPTEPGTYAFHCNIHSSMQGTLTVAA
jgi:plastocyanin